MTLFEHYQEKTKKALNYPTLEMVSETEVINFLKTQKKPGSKGTEPAHNSNLAEETDQQQPAEIEAQEGDEIKHENGTTYRFTSGSWLPVTEHQQNIG